MSFLDYLWCKFRGHMWIRIYTESTRLYADENLPTIHQCYYCRKIRVTEVDEK